MRERLDCAVLATGQDDWLAALGGPHAGGRLHLHVFSGGQRGDIGGMLADAALTLGRYDACLIHVDGAGLARWRVALASMRRPATHLLAYAVGLHARAIHDLYALGVADFVRPPFCAEDVRARIEHLLDGAVLSAPQLAEHEPAYGCSAATVDEGSLCDTILQRSGVELEAYAAAVASRQASSRESFREAKGRIIQRFERAYIHAALGRHRGNIAMAARAAQKHRRAFWALMRKHDIDPAPYRAEGFPAQAEALQGDAAAGQT